MLLLRFSTPNGRQPATVNNVVFDKPEDAMREFNRIAEENEPGCTEHMKWLKVFDNPNEQSYAWVPQDYGVLTHGLVWWQKSPRGDFISASITPVQYNKIDRVY